MQNRLLALLDQVSNWLERRKGAPVLFGVLLIFINLVLQPFADVPILGMMVRSNLFLHLGIIVSLLGILIGDAL